MKQQVQTPPDKNTTTTEQRKKRVQLKHLLIDVDFFDKPTVRALIYKHTQVSALLYMRWLMLMSRASHALVTRDALFSVGREVLAGMGTAVATPETVLAYCLKTGMITQVSEDEFTNTRVVDDQESCAVKRDQAIDRQHKFREKKSAVTNALPTRLPDTDTVTDTEVLDLKRTVTPAIEAPPPIVDAIFVPAWADNPKGREAQLCWQTFQRKKFKTNLDEMAWYSIFSGYTDRCDDFVRDVHYCISRGWKGLRDTSSMVEKESRAGPPRLTKAELFSEEFTKIAKL